MDQATLVEGQKLIDQLIESGFPITAACWMKESDGLMWYLYLATPLVGEDWSRRQAYMSLNAAMDALPQPLWVQPLQVKVVSPSEPVGRAILDRLRRHPGRMPLRFEASSLGGVSIEEAYLYPPPALSTAQ